MATTTTTIRTQVIREGPTIKFVSVQQGFISTISGLLTAIEMYMVFHGTAFFFYLSGGVSTIISSYHGVTIAAGVLGLVASVFHLIHTGFAYKNKI